MGRPIARSDVTQLADMDVFQASDLALATAMHGDDDEKAALLAGLIAHEDRTLILIDVGASGRLPWSARHPVPDTPEARAALWLRREVRRLEDEQGGLH